MKIRVMVGMLLGLVLALTGCSVERVRNADGSLTATSSITEASLSSEVARALENEQVSNVAADLQDGYITVTADRKADDGSTQAISFRLELGNADGRLTAQISEFTVNGQAVAEARIDRWNEKIAKRLERRADKHPNRSLESVSITDDVLTMVWHVEKSDE
jgi:hypothetical protein